jgi:hypothetical protein
MRGKHGSRIEQREYRYVLNRFEQLRQLVRVQFTQHSQEQLTGRIASL